MEEYFNHYIRTDAHNMIVKGFSDAFEKPEDGDILIDGSGGYQFRLFPGGQENPALLDRSGAPLYQWDGEAVRPLILE